MMLRDGEDNNQRPRRRFAKTALLVCACVRQGFCLLVCSRRGRATLQEVTPRLAASMRSSKEGPSAWEVRA